MSIKKLFGNRDPSTKVLSPKNNKDAFEDIESSKNLRAIKQKQSTHVPQVIDYKKPNTFAKFGSAYLYYDSAVQRILDYYPYDGSDAEINEFYNKSLDIDRYILDNLYPRTNGYGLLSADGWGSKTGAITNGYGYAASQEYIEFKGGPGTGSGDTLTALNPDPMSSKFQYSNIYDTDIYRNAGLPSDWASGSRESNLKSDFERGVTAEFWLKKAAFANTSTQTEKEVIFDLWNNSAVGDHDYGRITIFLDGTVGSSATPFYVTVQSGSTNVYEQAVGTNTTLTSIQDWNHYAITLQNSGSDFDIKLYLNGHLDDIEKVSSKNFNELDQKDLMGRLGSLITASQPNPSSEIWPQEGNIAGGGKLSASIDEFRFWKVARTGREIGLNWFTQIRGGVNTDISNTTLGMYYKFNEGITGDTAVDDTVLDYGGRLCNGVWVGYDASSRNTGSAMVESGHAKSEYLDPIIYSSHPDVSTLQTNLRNSGSYHDRQNNSNILSMLPSWIIEEDENNSETDPWFSDLRKMTHIVGTYFDKMHIQITELSNIKNANYVSSSYKPMPFAQHLPQSLGLYTPEILVDSEITERFLNKTLTSSFEGDLTEIKNLIYVNLYNNLTNIYKTKGTERAVKNVFRCFYMNDDIVSLRTNAKNTEYTLSNKLKQSLVKTTEINFNNEDNTSAVIYQAVDGAVSTSPNEQRGYISGSHGEGKTETANSVQPGFDGYGYEDRYGFTAEADIVFPRFYRNIGNIDRSFLSCSLFGMYTAGTASSAHLVGTETTWVTNFGDSEVGPDTSNFQVHAIRESSNSKNVYFRISSSNHPYPFPELTSSVFKNVYGNNRWNISVRLEPKGYPYTGFVSGSSFGPDLDYKLIFKGINTQLNEVLNSFTLTASITGSGLGINFATGSKRLYAGAERTNITGTLINSSDVRINGLRYWGKSLTDSEILFHAKDYNNIGVSGAYENASHRDEANTQYDVTNQNYLFLNWNFENITASAADGQFHINDASTGSVEIRNNYGWLGKIGGYQHTGYGYGFAASSDNVKVKQDSNTFEFIHPEQVVSSDMIKILSDDDKVYGIVEEAPSYHMSLEKSFYGAVTKQMLDFFAGAIDFHNAIGHPVHRYRSRYKDLEKLRETFFRKVTDVQEVEKFLDYYKWFDESLATIISQLIPGSSRFSEDILNVVESHVLERNKYQSQFPTIEFMETDLNQAMAGAELSSYPWPKGHSPTPSSPRATNINSFFWRRRAKANSTELTSDDATLDSQRQKLKDIIWSTPTLSQSLPVLYTSEGASYQLKTYARRNFSKLASVSISKPVFSSSFHSVKGGVNFNQNKNIDFTYNALRPAGPVDVSDGLFIPENVLVGWSSEMEALAETHLDDLSKPEQKTKRYFRVDRGRNWAEGTYANTETSFAFPFNLMSSSVKSGYNRYVTQQIGDGLEITNLHNDTYGSLMEKPMQGPFTNQTVGGHQSRHVKFNLTGGDDYTNRPEAWKLLLGDYTDYPVIDPAYSGALAMASADYPWPEANEPDVVPYPMTASHKAWLYRDFVAKRPVNIRNIECNTGSTGDGLVVLGNYQRNYQVVNTFGAFATPRQFMNYQPSLPSEIIWDAATSSIGTHVRSILDIRRDDDSHTQLVSEYSVGYLLSGSTNKTVFVNRFSAPGGIETQTYGYQDFRASEYSVYNSLNYRNLTVIKPSQGSSGTTSEATGSTTTGIRVSDVCIDPATGVGKDYGLRSHLARHSARFGRNSAFITGTTSKIDGPATTAGGPGASTDQFPSMFKNQRNVKYVLDISNDGDIFDPSTLAVVTKSLHDNYFIGNPIPRSDKQYSWIGNSLISSSQFRYYGHAPMYGHNVGLFSSSSGYVSYYDGAWVSASSVVPELTRSFYQPTERLNTLTLDSLTGSGEDNVLGFSFDAPNTSYINNDILSEMQMGGFISGSTDYFNLLLTRRKDVFGWNWRRLHPTYHPIIADEHQKNQLSIVNSNRTITKYDLPPVSFRGRPAKINFNVDRDDTTLQVTHNNEKIYFNETALNNKIMMDLSIISTPLDYITTIAKNNSMYNLNWVVYSENIFPSARREMISSSRSRTDYDNLFWRDSRDERCTVGNALKTSFNVNRSISQSCWVLDPQCDFLTRTKAPAAHATSLDDLIASGGAGELQNNYFHFHNGVSQGNAAAPRNLVPAGLYSRKHGLSSPYSVVAPTGPLISATGSLKPYGPVSPFHPKTQIDIFGGEALWEAGSEAGILEKSGSTIVFVSKSSEPWFDEYNDFKFELNKIFKDHVIVPEFRISEHVQDYIEVGLNNRGKQNTFEIPGTNISSVTQSFYKDYSNSEFLRDFMNIKEDTLLQPHEIRLTVSAAIRFNPYKGFYPAQRTIDIVSQFSKSYGNGLVGASAIGANVFPYYGKTLVESHGGLLRPLMQTLYSPGILFNSIKSGLAVDYPIITDPLKLSASFYGVDNPGATPGNWMLTAVSGTFQVDRKAATGYQGGELFDLRVPFEAILKPDKYLSKVRPIDMEPHLSASLYASSSCGAPADETYSLMVSNFLGEVGNFFLKESNYTQLKSGIITDDLNFKAGSVYGARIKLRRSHTGPRTYQDESSSMGDNTGYGVFGAQLYSASAFQKAEFPIPQDPRQNEDGFRETFTMYSRPTAFGPPFSGRPAEGVAATSYALNTAPMDSINGFNWAYTPPYTNGEAWCDIVFRPSHTRSYDLETILSEINMVYWRADPGFITASTAPNSHGPILISALPYAADAQSKTRPYSGYNINSNAMQISASLNLLGVERILTQRKDELGNPEMIENTTAGQRWVIQPKFETPMMNFADNTVRAVDPTLPIFASGSVPRGMWHQFGLLPTDSSTGIFMEIGDIPIETLKFHYDVVNNNTVYNNSDAADTGLKLHRTMQSLTDLMGFETKETTKRLGELRESLIIREAIVAVPYTIESVDVSKKDKCGEFATTRKRFFEIPQIRVEAALAQSGTALGDSLSAAGVSIRKMIQKMQRYVLPPQFDFINNPDTDPLVMYIFEFEYEFDKDDLSYMWQNLAPRDYKKITSQHQSIAHTLDINELLSADDLCESENLRWMVFKVKQKSQVDYSDLITAQLGESTKDLFTFNEDSEGYKIMYNWPYDYLSFVELIKVDAEVLYRDPELVELIGPTFSGADEKNPIMGSGPIRAEITDLDFASRVEELTNGMPSSFGSKRNTEWQEKKNDFASRVEGLAGDPPDLDSKIKRSPKRKGKGY